MDTMQAIKHAIESLSSTERDEIEAWLMTREVREPAAAAYLVPTDSRLSVEDYLAFEEKSTERHEYVAGEIFAMAGPTLRHNVISLNLATAFHAHLRGGTCRAFINDVKCRIQVSDDDEVLYYPDVMVACGKLALDEHYLWEPKLVIEVLSPSTEMIDRREKALNYRRIGQLEEYVLVAQRTRHVAIYRRSTGWQPQHLSSLEDTAEFHSIRLSLPLTQIYESMQ
jgi:Uma2 family endonuclease